LLTKLRTAIAFYTCLPLIARGETLDFQGIALYAPLVGVGLGLFLGGTAIAGMGWHPQGALWTALIVVLLNLWITGGLHLDGAMDTADGLAVSDPAKRLTVMADSHTGAFGAIALVSIFASKLIGCSDLLSHASGNGWIVVWLLVNVYTWSRWGQLRAIHAFPYLKSEGKGKFHREGIAGWQVWLIGTGLIGANLGVALWQQHLTTGLLVGIVPLAITLGVGIWFNWQLGGQTGDTYGAIVEWSEALTLLVLPPLTLYTL
jgi:adenosylcobinamide-GDP ribazoletransferase